MSAGSAIPGSPTLKTNRRPALVALLTYAALALALFERAWRAPASTFIGAGSDPPAYAWQLVWTPYALRHGQNPLLTDHLNYPAGVNLMWNITMRLIELAAWPVTAAIGPVGSYNVMLTLGVVLSAWVARTVFRRYVAREVPAFVGGLLYGFSPYMLGHALGHLDLVWVVIPPLLLPLLEEILVRQRRPPGPSGATLGLLAAAQLLMNAEMLATEAVAGAVGTAALAIRHLSAVRPRLPHALRAFGAALVVFALLAAWPLATTFFGPQVIRKTVHARDVFVVDVANLVVPTSLHMLRPAFSDGLSARFAGGTPEATGYLGLPLLLVAAFTTYRLRREPVVGTIALSALGMVILSLGPHVHLLGRNTQLPLPWAVFGQLILGNVLPVRFTVYVFLLLGLLVAIGLDRALVSAPTVAALAAGALVSSFFPQLPFPSMVVEVPAFFRGEAVHRIPEGTVVLVAPYVDGVDRTDPMLWQAVAGMRYRVADGYFYAPGPNGRALVGPAPAALWRVMKEIRAGGAAPTLTPALRAELLDDLRRRDVRVAIVGPMANQAAMVELLRATFGRDPTVVDGVDVWWNTASTARPREPS